MSTSTTAGRRSFGGWLSAHRTDLIWVVVLLAVGIATFALTSLPPKSGLWLSDSRFYLFMTLRVLGESPATAHLHVKELFDTLGMLTDRNVWRSPNYPLFRGRPLYPIISAPLVAMFGYRGLLIIPLACWTALGPVLFLALRRFATSLAAGGAVVAVLLTGVATYLIRPMAEPITMIGMAAWIALLPWRGRTSKWQLIAIGVVVGLTEFTRPVTFFVAGPMVLLTLWAWRKPKAYRNAWLKTSAVTLAVVAVTTLAVQRLVDISLSQTLMLATKSQSVGEAIANYPGLFFQNLGKETMQALQDPATSILLAAGLVASVVLWRSVVPWLYVGSILGYLATYGLMPYATSLRTFLPTLILLAATFAIGVTAAQRAGTGDRYDLILGVRQPRGARSGGDSGGEPDSESSAESSDESSGESGTTESTAESDVRADVPDSETEAPEPNASAESDADGVPEPAGQPRSR